MKPTLEQLKQLQIIIEPDGNWDLKWDDVESKLCILISTVAQALGNCDENGDGLPSDCICNKKNINKEYVRVNSRFLNYIISSVSRRLADELK